MMLFKRMILELRDRGLSFELGEVPFIKDLGKERSKKLIRKILDFVDSNDAKITGVYNQYRAVEKLDTSAHFVS